ncbi:MAG: polysaccharide deacetylase family protein [Chitinivibrionales bacterium]|nr:polysaccharide deacetylase family protein [Chitinivibrionales bacterium]
MEQKFSIGIFMIISLFFLTAFGSDNVPPNTKPPKGLDPKKVPQFVTIGFDDNTCSTGVVWACNYLKDKKNQGSSSNNPKTFDNLPVKVTFLFIGVWPNSTYTMAAEQGHEIGNHTLTHHEAINDEDHFIPLPTWENDMKWCADTLQKFCPGSKIFGFRTPRLEYEAETFNTLKRLNFAYDCSIEHASGSPVWPYTLDNGAHSSAKQRIPVPKTPGLWEFPVHDLGSTTGFDYNFYNAGNVSGYASALKKDLDARYNGDRSPLIINAHTEYYSEEWPKENPNVKWNSSIEQRRVALAGVIDYALQKPDVRFVRMIDIIHWMRDPVEFGVTSVSDNSGAGCVGKLAAITAANAAFISITVGIEGVYSLEVFTVQGKKVQTITTGFFSRGNTTVSYNGASLSRGIYMVRLSADNSQVSAVRKVTIN